MYDNGPTQRGFTLLEVLIALAIISGVLVTIISTVNYHLSLIERHETITVATLIGREKLLETTQHQRDKKGNFEKPFQDYSFEIDIGDSPFKEVKLIKLDVIRDRERIDLVRFVRSRE